MIAAQTGTVAAKGVQHFTSKWHPATSPCVAPPCDRTDRARASPRRTGLRSDVSSRRCDTTPRATTCWKRTAQELRSVIRLKYANTFRCHCLLHDACLVGWFGHAGAVRARGCGVLRLAQIKHGSPGIRSGGRGPRVVARGASAGMIGFRQRPVAKVRARASLGPLLSVFVPHRLNVHVSSIVS